MICGTIVAVVIATGNITTITAYPARRLPEVVAQNPALLLDRKVSEAFLLPSLPKTVTYGRTKCDASTTEVVDGKS